MRYRSIVSGFLTVMAIGFAGIGSALAADWPSRSIRWIVPYPPAGTTDILARIMAQRLSDRLGQTIVIDNRPGAGNNLGTEIAIKSAPFLFQPLIEVVHEQIKRRLL